MSFSIAKTPSLKGKTALVTGGNIGLGFETVKAFASKGAHVLLAARNEEKGKAAVAEVQKLISKAQIELLRLDLASQRSIRAAAAEVGNKFSQLDLLINNAGIMAMPEMKTEDGFESQFGVNHLGHWSLTGLLMDNLLAAEQARVVTVTSTAHHLVWNIDFDDSGAIGRRYRRQDEIGTPFCVTVDFETLDDQAVTVRERDTMQQERVSLSKLREYLGTKLVS